MPWWLSKRREEWNAVGYDDQLEILEDLRGLLSLMLKDCRYCDARDGMCRNHAAINAFIKYLDDTKHGGEI
jgi:hypothetical protein